LPLAPLLPSLGALPTSPTDIAAWACAGVAAGLIIVGAFVRMMIPLRALAVASNLGFALYGALHPSFLMLLLHAALLPINIYRLAEMIRVTRRVTQARAQPDVSGLWLRDYMRSAKLKRGQVLFHKGDVADRLYLLAEGSIEFVEIQRLLPPGQIFGEIALFSAERRRGLTARCVQDSTVLSIDQDTVSQLFFQNPEFGFELVSLITSRLSADVQRLERALAECTARPVSARGQSASAAGTPHPPAPAAPT